jgi:hypothetical protein
VFVVVLCLYCIWSDCLEAMRHIWSLLHIFVVIVVQGCQELSHAESEEGCCEREGCRRLADGGGGVVCAFARCRLVSKARMKSAGV